MKRFLGAWLAVSALGLGGPAYADDKDAAPILDKAIKALGGEEKLAKAMKAKWTSKGTVKFGDNELEMTTHATVDGLSKHRSEAEGEANGNEFHVVTVYDGKSAWRMFGDNTMELDAEAVQNEKRTGYLQLVPMLVLPLKDKEFKVATDGEEAVDGKPAAKLKVTGPEGKTFTLFFDKEGGLPVKMTAVVKGFMGEDFTQETTYKDYKEFDGIKKATKLEARRDGEPFMKMAVTEFKVLDKVDADAFTEPK